MLYVIAFLLGTLALGIGAWKLGRQSDLWAILLAPVLLFASWRLLPFLEIHPGEGVAVGVAVVQFGLYYLIVLGPVLALLLAAGAWWQRRSGIAVVVLVGILLPGAALIGLRLLRGGPAAPGSRGPPVATMAARETYVEGYTWATDYGITADSECVSGSAAFLDGCRHAIGSHRSSPDSR